MKKSWFGLNQEDCLKVCPKRVHSRMKLAIIKRLSAIVAQGSSLGIFAGLWAVLMQAN
jgi:hypothetical protein